MQNDSRPLKTDGTWQRRFHRRHAAARRQIVATLLAAADGEDAADDRDLDHPGRSRRLAGKLCNCGRWPMLYQRPDGRLVRTSARCRSRICPTCAPFRTAELEHRVRRIVREIDDARLLTLTLAASRDPLRDQIDRLKDCFRRLRRRKQWKAHVTGGVMTFEVTWSARTQSWHPHLHVVIDGVFWPQAAIANEWERVTGDSRIVDIRRVPSREALVKYVSKYVSKSQTPGNLPDARLVEWCHAVHGIRMAQAFGSLHGIKVDADQTEREGPCEQVASIELIADRAVAGSVRAQRLLRSIPAVLRSDRVQHHRALARLLSRFQRDGDAWRRWRPPPEPPPDPQLMLDGVDWQPTPA